MTEITAEELAKVNSFPRLVGLLRDKLEWPINEQYEFEDVIFEYEPHDLGLKAEETAKLREIHQLRPLVTGQPWGIFFLSFDDKTMSVTVLRRILRALVVKQRASGQNADRAAWMMEDLIFAANFGKSGERELAFVHFSDGAATGDLPVMKVLGWNHRDTTLHNRHAAKLLSQRLTWPDHHADQSGWRDQWASAFEVGHREVITTSKELAVRLAALAGDIRARANQLLAAETEDGPMRTMLEAFRKNLIHDLDEDGFADMFAQTICYGLLAASISRLGDDGQSVIVADNLESMVPRTNPFLKELFSSFLHLGGRDKQSALDFDELGVRDVVDMLNKAKMGRVLDDFGNRNPKKDPVIHFYECFLKEYDKDQKVDAGIFYTPPAVVGFIVRGVDEMLRTEFDLPLGLADTSTWGELAARNGKITIPDHVDPNAPFVQILDPATGTGTFLVEVIDLIHKRMVETWKKEGKSAAEIKAAWNAYVPLHLLPRLTAFELKMAAYAIAHMKIGLKLVETGYTFGSDERAHILLTNSLQPARELDLEERMRLEAMAHEAERANTAKTKTPFTVVIGNPPYKGSSMNPSKDARGKFTFAGDLVQRFFQIRGEPLGERNPKWLNNDYVKFIAFGMRQIERCGAGVLGYITSNSWLDGPTFRGVRTEIIDNFPLLRIVDLHGNINRRETAPDGSRDEGVFAIEEGTNITVAGHLAANTSIAQIDLLGKEGEGGGDGGKLAWLESHDLQSVCNQLHPLPPIFTLVPMQSSDGAENPRLTEFYGMRSIRNIQAVNGVGLVTARDHFVIDFDPDGALRLRIADFAHGEGGDEEVCKRLGIPLKKGWDHSKARADIAKLKGFEEHVEPIQYRPFDRRFIFYHGAVVWRTVEAVMQHMTGGGNVVLLAATVAALFLANSAWAESYLTFWNTPIGVRIGSLEIAHSLRHVINDGLMTLFFFVVGLEIKRELLLGELKDLRVAALPVAAALGGMLVPVGLYLSLQLGEPGESGWGVVMATDIAFVVGCLAVLGDRVPRSLRIFVLSLAIIDDIGAILVIAIGYTANLDLVALGLGVFGVLNILSLRYLGVRSIAIYYLAGILTWLAVFASGVHPTIVGVVLGLLTPAYAWVGSYRFQAITHRVNAYLRGESAAGAEASTEDHHGLLHTVAVAARETLSPLERLETALHPWVAFGIMPVFAFANAGIPVTAAGFSNPLVLAVIAGLVLGKPIGIVAASWMAVRLRVATRPDELRWSVIAAAGALSGIGFTMALFIAGLALDEGLLTAAKLGILVASSVSAVIGLALLIVFLGRGQTATHQS